MARWLVIHRVLKCLLDATFVAVTFGGMTSVTITIDLETTPGEPLCSRVIDMPLKANMLGFHWIIQSLMCWDDDQEYEFTASCHNRKDNNSQKAPTVIGGTAGLPPHEVTVGDVLCNRGDKLIYTYGDWKFLITVTATGGRQRKHAKMLEMKGPSPIQNSRQAPGGWGHMWKTLTKLYHAKTMQGQHVIYNKMSKKERASVDFLGTVHDAYERAAERNEVGLADFQKMLPKVELFPRTPEAKPGFMILFNRYVSEDTIKMILGGVKEMAREGVNRQLIQKFLNDNILTEDTNAEEYLESLADYCGLGDPYSGDEQTGQLTPDALNRIIGRSRNAWDVVLNVVRLLSPHPQVATAMERATQRYQATDLTAAEVERMVEPLRECLRIVGSDEGRTALSRLAEVKWKAFSEIIGHKFNNEEARNHCLIPYLRMPLYFGLMEYKDQRGRVQLTQYGRKVLAESDFSMDEVERARANRELFEQLVTQIPHGDGPLVTYMVANLGIFLALDDLQELTSGSRSTAVRMYDDTLSALAEGLNIEEFGGMANAHAFSSSVMHLLEFSGFVDVDLDAGTQWLNSAGARFFCKCLRELTYHRVVNGLHDAAYSTFGYESLAS